MAQQAVGIGAVGGALALQRRGLDIGEVVVEHGRHLALHHRAQLVDRGVVGHGIALLAADTLLEGRLARVVVGGAVLPDIEGGVHVAFVAQHAVEHLHLGDAAAGGDVVGQPGVALLQVGVLVQLAGLGGIAVAAAQQADEEGVRMLDLVQADGDDLAAASLLVGDPPAQVEHRQVHIAPARLDAQRVESVQQGAAFGLHIGEGRRKEDAHLAVVQQGAAVESGVVWHGMVIYLYLSTGSVSPACPFRLRDTDVANIQIFFTIGKKTSGKVQKKGAADGGPRLL